MKVEDGVNEVRQFFNSGLKEYDKLYNHYFPNDSYAEKMNNLLSINHENALLLCHKIGLGVVDKVIQEDFHAITQTAKEDKMVERRFLLK